MYQLLPFKKLSRYRESQRGLSVVEILVSIGILAMISVALGMLSNTVYDAHAYNTAHGEVTQHARVVFERLDKNLRECTFNTTFPGWIVIPATINANDYPETLVIWKPEATAANPAGLPTQQEIIVYRPNPAQPNELWELTDRGGVTANVPNPDNLGAWRGLIASMSNNTNVSKTVLTPLLRPALDTTTNIVRGGVRFRAELAPTEAEFTQYAANTISWESMNWPLGLYGNNYGIANRSCFIELQLMPRGLGSSSQLAIPYVWSTSLAHEVVR